MKYSAIKKDLYIDNRKNFSKHLKPNSLALFVSNDITYQIAPGNANVGYAQFSIHQGRVIPINSALNWNGNLAIAHGRPPIITNYAYTINWNPLILPNHHYILT